MLAGDHPQSNGQSVSVDYSTVPDPFTAVKQALPASQRLPEPKERWDLSALA